LIEPGGAWFNKSKVELDADIDHRAAEAKTRWDDLDLRDMLFPELLNLAIEKTHAAQQIEREEALQHLLDELMKNAEKLVGVTRFVEILIDESKGYKHEYILAPFTEKRAAGDNFSSAVSSALVSRMKRGIIGS